MGEIRAVALFLGEVKTTEDAMPCCTPKLEETIWWRLSSKNLNLEACVLYRGWEHRRN